MKEAGTKVAPVGTRGSAHRHTHTYHSVAAARATEVGPRSTE
jgi:hypothetical protein